MSYGYEVNSASGNTHYSSNYSTLKIAKSIEVTPGMNANIVVQSMVGRKALLLGLPNNDVIAGSYISGNTVYVRVDPRTIDIINSAAAGIKMKILVGIYDG